MYPTCTVTVGLARFGLLQNVPVRVCFVRNVSDLVLRCMGVVCCGRSQFPSVKPLFPEWHMVGLIEIYAFAMLGLSPAPESRVRICSRYGGSVAWHRREGCRRPAGLLCIDLERPFPV